MARSAGSVALSKHPDLQTEKARKLGVDQSCVSRWQTGSRKPQSYEDRATLQRVYGIAIEAWDQPATASTSTAAAAA